MKKSLAIFEIILMISFTVSFSYIVNESSGNDDVFAILLANIGELVFSNLQSVNALEVNDANLGAYTCLLTKENEYCQSFPASECNDKCTTACISAPVSQVSECHGVCYDSVQGTCSPNSPKANCLGQWFNDVNGNVNECRQGCCVLGDSTQLVTEQRCNYLSSTLGIQKDFRGEVNNAVSCLALQNQKVEGACTYGLEQKQCKFVSKEECQNVIRGSFHENILCSNPDLETRCERQETTGCVEGKDEVYWFDSCGNRENIFDVSRAKSWNNGFILSREESCTIDSDGRKNCGSCNYLQGNVCGRATSVGEVALGDFVCKDLSCIDENGNERQHLESWCSYQGRTGLDEEENRATDPVGSRHFRNTCIRGEVVQDSCADYRNEICVESEIIKPDGDGFSTAACRLNRWQECISYNTNEKKEMCAKNPDCFVKNVNVGGSFNFNICSPKYPPGFVLTENGRGEGAEKLCSFASQKCTVVFQKDKCVQNCECLTSKFSEEMNNLCTSLGDCGASANYIGEFTSVGEKTSGASDVSANYISKIKKYADEEFYKDIKATPGDLQEFYGSLGASSETGKAGFIDPSTGAFQTSAAVQQYAGIAGLVVMVASTQTGLGLVGSIAPSLVTTNIVGGVGGFYTTELASPALGAVGGALTGAAIGLALTGLVLKWTGAAYGIPSWATYTLLGAGAVGGALAGIAFAQAASAATAAGAGLFSSLGSGFGALLGGGSALGPVGLVIVVVVIIVTIILGVLFGGKPRQVVVSFECKPWQAPLGGNDCSKCGSDGFPCSRYSCQSLGQTCQIINENSDEPVCVDISPNDINPPIIKPWTELISLDHKYENVSDEGFRITGPEECVEPYTNLLFGISLDEPGQCRIDSLHTANYDEMENQFGISSLFRYNHTTILPIPSLESLGVSSAKPNATASFNFFVRCQDKNGNKNVREFNVGLCIKQAIDITPPVITFKEPITNIFAWNSTSEKINLFVSEPAECKWDNSDRPFDLMNNGLNCETDPEVRELFGWRCTSEFPVTSSAKTYYVKCKDQPWLGNDTKISNIPINKTANRTIMRNVAMQSYNFTVRRSESALRIEGVNLNGTFEFGNAPASVDLIVKTSGGVTGRADCSYRINANYLLGSGDSFIPPGQTTHIAHLELFEGNHDYKIECKDEAGNTAFKTGSFEIEIDREAPKIARTYLSGNVLRVVTDEQASCYYTTTENCVDIFTNGSSMSGQGTRLHTTSVELGKTYRVSCKDRFDRSIGSACQLNVKAG